MQQSNTGKKRRYIILAKCYDRKGRMLSVGTNSYKKSHTLMKHFAELAGEDPKIYLHSEVQALLRAKDKQVHRITVERYDASGNPALAKPCKVCQKAIQAYGVKFVEYTSEDGWIKEEVQ